LGFVVAAVLNFIFKKSFVTKKKALRIQKDIVNDIKQGSDKIKKIMSNDESKKNLDLESQLHRDLVFWSKLEQKVENASFLCFLLRKV
jgi:hypothetical protein